MIGTSTGEVYEDSVDHILDTPNKRVNDSFNDLNVEKPIMKPPEPSLSGFAEGAKAAQWVAWAALRGNPVMDAAMVPLTVLGMHAMKNEIVSDVKKQLSEGVPMDKIEFKKGSAGDGFGLFSYLHERFGKPVDQIKPEDKPLYANIKGEGSDLEGPYYSKKTLDNEEIKGPGAIAGILQQHLRTGGKVPQLDYDSMPLSTNIEDRRNEDPIGNLIRREDWGKSGLR